MDSAIGRVHLGIPILPGDDTSSWTIFSKHFPEVAYKLLWNFVCGKMTSVRVL